MNQWFARAILLIALAFFAVENAPKAKNPVAAQTPACSYSPLTADILAQTSPERYLDWIEDLSGAEDVVIGALHHLRILSRNTTEMFSGNLTARAYEYGRAQLLGWYPEEQVIEQEYPYFGITARNIIAVLPGITKPEEVTVLGAHLDSTAWFSRTSPGADDNGSGSAALLEAARLLRQYRFERTIHIVFFTGEEQGLVGSQAYVAEHGAQVVSAINLDMFGWDGDGDRCFEIDMGDQVAGSQEIGQCIADSVTAYSLGLSYDLYTHPSVGSSDHISFWKEGIPAVAIFENAFEHNLPGGCVGVDFNPHYHSAQDTVQENLTPVYAYDIFRAALAATASLAGPLEACFSQSPELALSGEPPQPVQLTWTPVSGAQSYRVWRSSSGCEEGWQAQTVTDNLSWTDASARPDWPYAYQVEALGAGSCVSPPSSCVEIGPLPPAPYHFYFLPFTDRE